MNEREFGTQIKRHLDRSLDLDAATLNRLRTARERALARRRTAEHVFVPAWAHAVVGRLSGSHASTGIALAGAALIVALIAIQQYWMRTPSIEEIEEIDAAILTSDLPINAYLDKSFDSWLKRSQH